MKKGILLLVFFIALGYLGWGQKTLTWQSTSSTDWTLVNNWYDEGTGATSATAPNSADVVTINNSRGASVNPILSGAVSQTIKKLTVGNGFTLTLTSSQTFTSTTGLLMVGDATVSTNDIIIQNGGVIDNIFTGTAGNGLYMASANDIMRIDAGGKYIHNSARSFGTPWPQTKLDLDNISTIEFGQNSGTGLTASARTYGNLTLSATAVKTYTASGGGAFIVNGTLLLSSSNVTFSPAMNATQATTINNLTITGGTFNPGSTNAWTISFTGNITNNGTLTLPGTNVNIIFNGISSISGSGSFIFANGFTINSTKSLSLSKDLSILTSKTGLVNGILDCGISVVGGAGAFTLASGGTLLTANNSGIGGSISVSGTISLNTGANYSFNGYSTQVTGANLPTSVNNFTIDNSAGVLLSNTALTVNGTLLINSGKLFTIEPGKQLTVSGTLTNSAGPTGLVIASSATGTGSLIHNSNDVPATVQTYVTGSANLTANKYHFVSIPTQYASPTASLFMGSYLYKLDASQQEPLNNNDYGKWVDLGNVTTTPLSLSSGYMIYYPNTENTYSFTGNLNNGDFSTTVTGHAGSGVYTLNLVPNPYPSAINWKSGANWTRVGIGGSCYIWSSSTGNYTTVADADNYIPVGQAFIVLVSNEASPVLTVKNAARAHSSQAFYKSTEEVINQLTMKAEANGYSDLTVVAFKPEATEDFDLQIDGIKMLGLADAPQLYSVTADKKFSLNNLPLPTGPTTVPVNFETQFAGEVTLTFSQAESFRENVTIQLEDKLTGQFINLRQQQTYTFTHQPTNSKDRFVLHFGGAIGITENNPAIAGKAFISNGHICIEAPAMQGSIADVSVYNALGQLLGTNHLMMNGIVSVNAPQTSGIFIIHVSTASQHFVSKVFNK